ncbi:serine/threonine-protein kinase pakF-like isoform X3 [Papaver somniferum]|uniref:serine/threonine-protein kinase pakF-like isoform X3 n=1 Tax=Papaver somniferum TaxID=3469 RepID=UPI000E6F89F7|nr:serine/threonine-protein kinase pakF-like isoform X3 [Papaver somniferum]
MAEKETTEKTYSQRKEKSTISRKKSFNYLLVLSLSRECVEIMERRKYPIGNEHYELYEEVGQGVSASVYRAICIPNNEIVAIKIIDFERHNSDLANISREAQTMILVDNPNVLRAYCSFVSDHNLWVVMPFMEGGSCLHILKSAYPDGFKESVIATILREILKGLEYLHQHGHIHRDVKAGNILVDARGAIKLGDFGVSACLFDSGDRQRTRNTFVGTPCWMAPEVMEQLNGYDFKADIWSFGITALELAHGHAPFSKYPPMKVLLMTLQNAPPGLDYERDKKFSKSFKNMIAQCLVKEPSKRPSARKLLKHPFFKQARSNDYICRTLLEGLPTLGDRMKELKKKDEDMLAQKKMPDGEKEEISQNEYKRGISGWNFNVEDMKAQASLIQDGDEPIADKLDQGGSSNSLMDASDKENVDMVHHRSESLHPIDSNGNFLRGRWDKSEDDLSVAGSTSDCEHLSLQDDFAKHIEHVEHDRNGRTENKVNGAGRRSDSMRSPRWSRESYTNLPDLSIPTFEDESIKQNQNSLAPDTPSVPSKPPSSSGEDLDEKAREHVVQQKGRFKVTSEKAQLEKALSTPMLQKSQSLQVISQPLTPTSQLDASSNSHDLSVFSLLDIMLQTNIVQRDHILSLMKQCTSGNLTAGGSNSTAPDITESLLELSHERTKQLLQEMNEQWRHISSVEEFQRLKPKTIQDDLQCHVDQTQHERNESFSNDTNGLEKRSENQYVRSARRSGGSDASLQDVSCPLYEDERDKQAQNGTGVTPQTAEETVPETLSKSSKSCMCASNGEDFDEKAERPVVQQKGRFKVTSEKPQLEKALSTPILQKYPSFQVSSLPPTPTPQFDAASSNPQDVSSSSHLFFILQTNVVQRENVLLLIKQHQSSSNLIRVDGGNNSSVPKITEKLLEASSDRAKELEQEKNELQMRLVAVKEYLEKCKADSQVSL